MWLFSKKEKRASIQDPNTPLTADALLEFLEFNALSSSGVKVNIDNALGVPAVWGAVNFLSSTLAGLPLHVYRRNKEGRKRVKSGLHYVLHDAPNDETNAFDFFKYSFDQVFTGGASFTVIDRNEYNNVTDLYPLIPKYVEVKRVDGKKLYEYKLPGTRKITYTASEIIDISFMKMEDGLGHYSPIKKAKEAIGLKISATRYGSKFFNNGGVPPYAISGPFQTKKAMGRASEDLAGAITKANDEKRLILPLPENHQLHKIGTNPENSQLVELQKFCNEEIARIYSLPVVFIQDLSKGTFSNTEQQDLHLVKHTLKRWVEQVEKELNLKLFGRGNNNLFVEYNMDSLLRGDFKTRMEGYSKGIQNAIYTPNEVRRKENLPDDPNGDSLMIQGATVPVENQLSLDLSSEESE